MTIRSAAQSILAKLPLPQGLKNTLLRLAATRALSMPAETAPATERGPLLLYSGPPVPAATHSFRSKSEYDEWLSSNKAALGQRLERELTVLPAVARQQALTGYCVACATNRNFRVDVAASDSPCPLEYSSINWRESLLCESCGLNNRMRASIDLFTDQLQLAPASAIYMTEQVTPLYRWAKHTYPGVIGSEYLGEGKTGGGDYEGIRHEDTTRLSFASDSLDCVLSFDVLEHIPDYKGALKEIFRCLQPGGFLLLSAPFVSDNYPTRVRAQLLPDGRIEHLLPEEYHGNPTEPGSGSLCFYHFGWDLLDEISQAALTDARVLAYYSFERGNFGKPQLFFWARKLDRSSA